MNRSCSITSCYIIVYEKHASCGCFNTLLERPGPIGVDSHWHTKTNVTHTKTSTTLFHYGLRIVSGFHVQTGLKIHGCRVHDRAAARQTAGVCVYQPAKSGCRRNSLQGFNPFYTPADKSITYMSVRYCDRHYAREITIIHVFRTFEASHGEVVDEKVKQIPTLLCMHRRVRLIQAQHNLET